MKIGKASMHLNVESSILVHKTIKMTRANEKCSQFLISSTETILFSLQLHIMSITSKQRIQNNESDVSQSIMVPLCSTLDK